MKNQLWILFVAVMSLGIGANTAWSQIDTGDGIGDNFPQVPGGGGGGGNSPFDFGDFDLPVPNNEFEDERQQPFVGPSTERFEEQGLGHPRSRLGPGGSSQGGGFSFDFGGFQGGRGGGAAGQGTGNGFQVVRGNLRTRVVPRIEVTTRPSANQVTARCQQVLNRVLVNYRLPSSVQVEMAEGVAYLKGSVSSAEVKDRLERMLRLEPGVSRIENQIEVSEASSP